MSRGVESEGGQDGMWGVQPWVFSNSDNSGGNEQRSKKLLQSQPTSPASSRAKRRNGNARSNMKGPPSSKNRGVANLDPDHTLIERERRKKMRNMFTNLHELLPHLPPKVDKSTIVDEAVSYIKSLEQTFRNLERQKQERVQGALSSYNESSGSLNITSRPPPPPQRIIDSRPASLLLLLPPEQGENRSSTQTNTNNNPVSFSSLSGSYPVWSSPNAVVNVSGSDAHISLWATKKPVLVSDIVAIIEKHRLEMVSCSINSDYLKCMYMIHVRVAEGAQFQGSLVVQEICWSATNELLSLFSP